MPPRTESGGSSLPKTGSSTAHSIYPSDTVQDVAESLGLPPLKESVAATLAADVEYRLRQVVQDASKFMRHGKRTQLRVADVDRALKQRNIEPIFGFHPTTLGKSSISGAYPTPVGSTFRRIQTQSGPIHIVADEEIDLDKVLESDPKVGLGPGVGWSAHWLAIEGVQPAVPQNPSMGTSSSAAVNATIAPGTSSTVHHNGASAVLAGPGGAPGQTVAKPLIKHVLSRELQLYFERLTTAIADPPREAEVKKEKERGEERGEREGTNAGMDGEGDVSMGNGERAQSQSLAVERLEEMAARSSGNTVRDAALASLRGDSGLHQLVPYLIQWVGERVQDGLRDEKTLEVMLQTINAIVMNPFLGIESYLHQLLPFVLSILLTSTLGASTSSLTYVLRTQAASILAYLVARYASTYPTLKPRLVRTVLAALDAGCKDAGVEDGKAQQRGHSSASPSGNEDGARGPRESSSTKLGAMIGLRKMGPSAVQTLLVQELLQPASPTQAPLASCHLKRLGNWCERVEMIEERRQEVQSIVEEVVFALHELATNFASGVSDADVQEEDEGLDECFGHYWLQKVANESIAKRALRTYLAELRREERKDSVE